MESPPYPAAFGRGRPVLALSLASSLSLLACGEPARDADTQPSPRSGSDAPSVTRDTSALVRPPEWPRRVQWSDAIANQGQLPLQADADGVLDLLLLGRGPAVAYLARGRGDGSFQAPELIHSDRLGVVTGATAAVDVNADGFTDLVYLSALSNNDAPRRARVTALLSRGDGSFEARVSDFDGYAGPLTATDLNADGHPDLLVACPASNQERSGQSLLFALIAAGDGTFAPRTEAPVRLPKLSSSQLLTAKLRGPHSPSLIVAGHDEHGAGVLSVHSLSGAQIGASELALPLGAAAPFKLTAADLDGDGRSELVFYSATERRVTSIRFDLTGGTLVSELMQHEVEGDSYALSEGFSLTDIDDDGALDLLLPASDTRSTEGYRFGPVLILAYGDGTGRFDSHRVLQLAARDGEFGAHAFAADLNADGVQDLSLGTYGILGASGRTGVLLGPLRK